MSPVTIDEYLTTEYEPECEFVDGQLEDRHAGYKKHGLALTSVMIWLHDNALGQCTVPILRIQLSPSCVRVADVCVLPSDVDEEVPNTPPLLWVEILSPEDRLTPFLSKLNQLINFGVPTVWIVDPYHRQAWIATGQRGLLPARVLRCENLDLQVALDEILPLNVLAVASRQRCRLRRRRAL